ncbi:hypothetical protein DXG03_009596 [Asterophora parasitica]|uniref:Beta-lactamase-related domain-containing protein n=1 Tax=Asterophora parasitica TaxID=117018 RepID=A0A9P7G6I7_9AGAR|nr:hypothetical protein DXG03_009596 [Asterophora parasitica]
MRLWALTALVPFFIRYGGVSVSAQGLTSPQVLTAETDKFINDLLAEWNSPAGLSVAVVRKDEQGQWNVETKGYGVATLANKTQVTEKTLFAIGSNSKLLTAIATGLLVTNQTLPNVSWTSKLASLMPGFGLQDSIAAKQATLIDALSHRTGLPRHDFSYKTYDDVPTIVGRSILRKKLSELTRKLQIKKVKYQRPSAEFRDVGQYNNNMYTLLSYLPTVVLSSKIPFARYVKAHIFEPLGLTSTTYSYDVAKLGHLADGIAKSEVNLTADPFGGTPRAIPFWFQKGGEDGNNLSGAGGIISNAVDLATWLQTLLLEGQKPGTNQSVIPPEVIEKVSSGITVFGPAAAFPELSPSVYGGGQLRSTYRGHELVSHDGGVPEGFSSVISRFPSDDLGIAVISNDFDYGGIIAQIVNYRLMDEGLGLEKIDWNGRFKPFVTAPPPPTTPRPANATLPSASFQTLAGIYENPGYGKAEFCFVSSNHSSASQSCKALIANVSTILPGAVDPKIPTFIAQWDSPWASHIRLRHFSGNLFNTSGLTSYPTHNTTGERYWVSGADGSVEAEIITTGGRISLAITNIWGAGDVEPLQGKTLRDRAQVLFDKL